MLKNDVDSTACPSFGYLLLEDCAITVSFPNEEDENNNDSNQTRTPTNEAETPTGLWFDVDIAPAIDDKHDDVSPRTGSGSGSCCCPRCSLVLTIELSPSSSLSPQATVEAPSRFDGTMSDLTCHAGKCPLYCTNNHDSNRSDAALLLGLAVTCQDHGRLEIKRVRMILYPKEDTGTKVDLCIILAIPQPNIGVKKSKHLFPSMQLLLSLIRSDWQYLENRIQTWKERHMDTIRPATFANNRNEQPTSLFPPGLSLEELYVRLRGASHEHYDFQASKTPNGAAHKTNDNSSHDDNDDDCPFMKVPQDVIESHIAPYLKARSLDAMRCSCTYLHQSTRGTVPGLKLSLYQHQIKSLDWMRRREIRDMSEDTILNYQYPLLETQESQGDFHRTVSGGASVRLCVSQVAHHNNNNNNNNHTIRMDPLTGKEILMSKNCHRSMFAPSRKIARGGLLCDDPGLGKTITVLSLILQTMDLTTEKQAVFQAKENSNSFVSAADTAGLTDENKIFDVYWKEEITSCFRRPALNKLVMDLTRWKCSDNYSDFVYFLEPVDPLNDCCPDYFDVIERPICFNDILKMIQKDDYGRDFEEFRSDVNLCFENALAYNPVDHPVSIAASRLSNKFANLVDKFKCQSIQSAKKSFSSSCAKPNSSVAAIIEERAKQKLAEALISSCATLLIVPDTLENHWEEQINMHMDLSYCTNKVPIVFHYTPHHARNPEFSSPGSFSMLDLISLYEKGTHCPLVFFDKATNARLPNPNFLSMFRIVVTTNQRLSNEWKNGSYEEELKINDSKLMPTRIYLDRSSQTCPLLKVHWLRLIVDEGHSMGRGRRNNAIQFASWIEAQRRWVMTGTPTPQTLSQNGLSNILGLMNFLQHDFFSAKLDGEKVWHEYIVRNWNEGNLVAFFRLRSLLLLLMIRHTKHDIEELAQPKFRKEFSIMSKEEIIAYNTLVCAIQSNLVTTAMEGKTSGKQDSLLHRQQGKHARDALSNVRLACSGGTQVVPTLTQKNWDETIELLQYHGVDGIKLTLAKNFLHRAVTEQLSGCLCCGMQLSTLMVLPCGDLVCTECMNSKAKSCPVCNKKFDVDHFQLLQPGIEYTWKWNLEEARKGESSRQLPLEDARRNEIQPLEIIDVENLAGVVALQPASVRQTRTRRRGDGHACDYNAGSINGKCKLCFEEHDECTFLYENSKCAVCHRIAEPCPEEESKFFYLTQKLEQLLVANKNSVNQFSGAASRLLGESVTSEDKRPLKVIIFSQFRPILNLVGHRLLRRFGPGCVAEYWGKAKRHELAKFSKSLSCFCMLLGKDGSEGLDLSFVTHIFFMDEVWDKSLENQVISRAYRMGAKGHVEVETVVAKDSVEEMMTGLQESLSTNRITPIQPNNFVEVSSASVAGTAKEYQSAKLLFLLKHLTLIRNSSEGMLGVSVSGKRKRVNGSGKTAKFAPIDTKVSREAQPKLSKAVKFKV